MPKRWTCLEVGCGHQVVADDTVTVVERAQRHMQEAHHSVELEDVVEAAIDDVPDGTAS